MYVDGEGKLHFVNGSGADTVIPFNSNKFCLEYEIDYSALEREQRKAIISRIRYNNDAKHSTKLKYGFYGEVLLDLILRVFLKTSVLAANKLNISSMANQNRNDVAYNLIAVETPVPGDVVNSLLAIDGVIAVRVISAEAE